jgi:TolB-like protein/DNA-binding winged helix-turn-helix (wHTH) protein/Tfp pilus assembly protein PilF
MRETKGAVHSVHPKGRLRFSGLTLDLDACLLRRESGEIVALTRSEFSLLRLLAQRPDWVFSREALLAALSNRRFTPFDRSVDVVVARLRRKIEIDPKAPSLIVTVPGEGYRFDGLTTAPVHARTEAADRAPAAFVSGDAGPLDEPQARSTGPAEAAGATRWSISPTRFAAVLAAVLSLAAAATYGWQAGHRHAPAAIEDKPATAPRLSIVVLPFHNLSRDPEQDSFADGITDDLTTDLSHLSGSFVISHGAAFTYKGRAVDPRQIGRELGVRYLLEGSVKRVDDRIAVNARLVATESGAQVWADRFDGERARSGELQVEFVSRLVNSLGDELVKAEASRTARERPNNPGAADLAMRGWALANLTDSKARFNEAINLFERALSLDSQNVEAMTGLALILMWRAYDGWSDDFEGDMARAEEIVSRALMIQPNSSLLHNAYANLLGNKRQWQAAIAENETAIAYDRNNAFAYAVAGLHKAYVGREDEGIADIETALRLSPRDGSVPNWQYFLCHINNLLGRWERAIEWCNKSIAGNPELTDPLLGLAAAYAGAGHDDEAKNTVARIEKARPGFTLQKIWPAEKFSDDPSFRTRYARVLEGLRKAGVPEGESKPKVNAE